MRSLAGPSMCDLVGESVMRSQLALCRPFVEQSSRSDVRLDKHAPTITYTLARNHPLSDHRVSRLLDLANPERTLLTHRSENLGIAGIGHLSTYRGDELSTALEQAIFEIVHG